MTSTPAAATSPTTLDALLEPVLEAIARLQPESRTTPAEQAALVQALEERFPASGAWASALREEISRGIAEGTLCHRGEPNARFSRIAKPGTATHGLSVDVVALRGEAVRHTHDKGEVTLGFAAPHGPDGTQEGDTPAFDGHPPGWVFMGPGSTHTPTVTGGTMHLIYFLPGGAVTWHA